MKKSFSIEIMRIVAAFFVIYNHTLGFWSFKNEIPGSMKYWLSMFLSVFCKFSVPLFFMISGALLLNKYDGSIKKLYKKIFKFIFLLIVVTFMYYLVYIYKKNLNFSFSEYFRFLYSDINEINYSLWYLYAYISFLVMIPILSMITNKLERNTFMYLMLLMIIFGSVIPLCEELFFSITIHLNGSLSVEPLIKNVIFYPIIGAYLFSKVDYGEISKKHVLIGWIINLICISISCFLNYKVYMRTGLTTEASLSMYHMLFVYINSIMIFITLKKLENRIHNFCTNIKNIIQSLGSCTFGIYLSHIFILNYTWFSTYIYDYIFNPLHIYNSVICSLILSLFCFIICYLITCILKKLPYIKYFI